MSAPLQQIMAGLSVPAYLDPGTASGVTLSNGNLNIVNTGTTAFTQGASVIASAIKGVDKWYWEGTAKNGVNSNGGARTGFGVGNSTATPSNISTVGNNGVFFFAPNWTVNLNGSADINLGSNTGDQIFAFALDGGNKKFYVNRITGTPSGWNGAHGADPTNSATGYDVSGYFSTGFVPFGLFGGSGCIAGNELDFNFGLTAFTGAVPAGYFPGWPR